MYPLLLPAWFPSDIVLIGVVAFIAAIILMNKGQWWTLNLYAQDEPLVFAGGITIALLNGHLASLIGGPNEVYLVVGGLLAVFGVVARVSDRIDISGVV